MPSMGRAKELILLPPILFSLLLFHFSWAQSQEQEVLLKLKSHWGNPTSLSTWNNSSTTRYCDWVGIVCTNNSITNITLREDTTIAGSVPSFICNLTNLSVLDLYDDAINTTFPDLSGCRSLTHLNLGQNYLAGTLPDDLGSVLPKLVYLHLAGNSFSGDFPASISNASSLQKLCLDKNQFGSFPSEIGNIPTLEVLTLAYNPFSRWTLPAEYGNLKNLTYLSISNANLIDEIPETFGEMAALQHLDLSNNSLTGRIPARIWSLKDLSYLYLYTNNLNGEIPATIGATKLVAIDLSNNQLNGSIPEGFAKLQHLTILRLYQNNFSGNIPLGIANITSLRDIRLFRNDFSGILPPDLGKYSNLYNFEVSENNLTGELPRHLCQAGALNSLVVFDNNLNGTVPESLGSCSSLVNIQLYNNRFSGNFPSRIWSLTDLSVVIIHDNDLHGELLDELPWNFTRLDIRNNRFSGKIPTKGGNLTVFYGSNNLFSGELPTDMGGISQLQELILDGNELSGPIPTSVQKLESLTNLNLSNNQLSGEIPEVVGTLPVLTYLDLSNNNLSGEIPSELGNLTLNKFNLSDNSLSGKIPWQFENGAYSESFLSNPGLCSTDESVLNVTTCSSQTKKSELSKGLLVLFIVLGIIVFLAAVLFAFWAVRDLRRRKLHPGDDEIGKSKLTSFSLITFTESNIFSGLTPENLIGSGASGQVYKIVVNGRGAETVAVKKIWNNKRTTSNSKLDKEFHSEVAVLGSIRHMNIVKLLCCIAGPESKLLVYEYMKNGSLDQWLRKKTTRLAGSRREEQTLDWPTRMKIAIGAAQGLSYMHHECSPPIVHRDVKSSNILLDDDFNPKVADFGLARILKKSDEPEFVSSFAGSFGYMAPECAYTTKVDEKIDVYSFGVILLELTTGREANGGGANGNNNLAEWTWRHIQEGGSPAEIADGAIGDSWNWSEEISAVMRLGVICTGRLPSSRPTMKEVLQVLLRYSGHRGGSVGEDDGGRRDNGSMVAEVPLLKKGSKKSVEEKDNGDSGDQ